MPSWSELNKWTLWDLWILLNLQSFDITAAIYVGGEKLIMKETPFRGEKDDLVYTS